MFTEGHKNSLDLMAEVQFYWQEISKPCLQKVRGQSMAMDA